MEQPGAVGKQEARGRRVVRNSPPGKPHSRQQAAQQALDRITPGHRRYETGGIPACQRGRFATRGGPAAEATDALGGLQQQDADGRLSSMAQTAEQLANRQKQQADQVRDLLAQLNAADRAAGKQPKFPSAEEIDKMVNDRQAVSDELGRLTQQLRNAARELAPTQPTASGKLRSALEGMDENDLGTRLQRSSDQLRSGQFSDQAESALTSDLQKLSKEGW